MWVCGNKRNEERVVVVDQRYNKTVARVAGAQVILVINSSRGRENGVTLDISRYTVPSPSQAIH